MLGFMGAFRRSEISGLDVTDIKRVHQGIIVTVRQSKTDQQQMGQQVGIPCISDDDFDCVKAVEQWITAANLVDGPLSARFSRTTQLLKTGLVPRVLI